jgi:hypothetical protein
MHGIVYPLSDLLSRYMRKKLMQEEQDLDYPISDVLYYYKRSSLMFGNKALTRG